MCDKKRIAILRKFFAITTAAFELQHEVSRAFGYLGSKSYMYTLHLKAKSEAYKEQPDLKMINNLLILMEVEVKVNQNEFNRKL